MSTLLNLSYVISLLFVSKRLIIKLLLIVSFGQGLFAQANFINFRVEEGLPSNETHWAYEDSEGILWVATDKGLSRFNGYEFNTFSIADGLIDHVVFRCYEDPFGRLWLEHFDKRLSIFEDGKFVPYAHNDTLLKYSLASFPRDISVAPDSSLIYIPYGRSGAFTVSASGDFEPLSFNPSKDSLAAFSLIEVNGNPLVYPKSYNAMARMSSLEMRHPSEARVSTSSPERNYIDAQFQITMGDREGATWVAKRYKEDQYLFATSSKLYLLKDASESSPRFQLGGQTQANHIHSLDYAHDRIWLGTNQGLIVLSENFEVLVHLFENMPINAIHFDQQGGLWIASQNQGLWYCSYPFNIGYLNYPAAETQGIIGIAEKDQEIYLAYFDNHLGKIDTNGNYQAIERNPQLPIGRGLIDKSDLKWDSLGNLWHAFFMRKMCDDDPNCIYRKSSPVSLSTMVFEFLPNGDILGGRTSLSIIRDFRFAWISYTSDFIQLGKESLIIEDVADSVYLRRGPYRQKTYDIHSYGEGKVLIGSENGLHKMEYSDFTYSDIRFTKMFPEFNTRIVEISENEKGEFWMASAGSGLCWTNLDSLICFGKNEGVPDHGEFVRMANKLDQVFYAGSDGLYVLAFSNDEFPQLLSKKRIGVEQGLPSNEITGMLKRDSTLLLSTASGFTEFDYEELERVREPIQAKFIGVSINDRDSLVLDQYRLSYTENSLEFRFIGIDLPSLGSINYRYRLNGLESDWKETKERQLLYGGLRPGNYVFEVEASREGEPWRGEGAMMQILILKPWWQTWAFRIISSLVVIAGLFVFARSRNIRRQRKLALEKAIDESRQIALGAQMNPHFVFNSINSIQNVILKQDRWDAYNYLTRFAQLMRRTLNNLRNPFISISDELSTLEDYLAMENLRFEEGIDWNITYSDDLPVENWEVPGMLIQPFVENSIWHGILPMEDKKGKIEIEIKATESVLEVRVEDNGIGRERAMENKRQQNVKHKSKGIDLTRERLELIHRLFETKFSFEYQDVLNAEGKVQGTRVLFTIPHQKRRLSKEDD